MNDQEQRIKNLEDLMQEHTHNELDGTAGLKKVIFVTVNLPSTQPQTAANFGIFFTATRPCYVKAISEKHTVAGNDAGAVTLNIERLQGTTVLDSGTTLLSTAFNLKGTAYTTQRGVMNRIKTTSSLNIGDSLALKDVGTLTTLQGVQVTLEIQT